MSGRAACCDRACFSTDGTVSPACASSSERFHWVACRRASLYRRRERFHWITCHSRPAPGPAVLHSRPPPAPRQKARTTRAARRRYGPLLGGLVNLLWALRGVLLSALRLGPSYSITVIESDARNGLEQVGAASMYTMRYTSGWTSVVIPYASQPAIRVCLGLKQVGVGPVYVYHV